MLGHENFLGQDLGGRPGPRQRSRPTAKPRHAQRAQGGRGEGEGEGGGVLTVNDYACDGGWPRLPSLI